MGRFLVGVGLVVMLSAVAFFSVVANDPTVPVSQVNNAVSSAVWTFLAGTAIAIVGGLQRTR